MQHFRFSHNSLYVRLELGYSLNLIRYIFANIACGDQHLEPAATVHFPGGESDVTLCRNTSKSRQKPRTEIHNNISNLISTPASQLRYNLTVPGF
jgi:hypothetical protein